MSMAVAFTGTPLATVPHVHRPLARDLSPWVERRLATQSQAASTEEARLALVLGVASCGGILHAGLRRARPLWRRCQTQQRQQAQSVACVRQPVTLSPVDHDSLWGDEFIGPRADDYSSDLVLFDSAVYFVEEEEGCLSVDVIRLGPMKKTIHVDYYTEDGSAKAGKRYKSVSGSLTFLPGELSKTFNVPIIPVEKWDTTLEFRILLTNPKQCELGEYLFMSRVKVIGPKHFPSNRFQAEMEKYGSEPEDLQKAGVSGVDLFGEYCKLALTVPGVASTSVGILIIDVMQNLYFLFTTYLIQYVSNVELSLEPEKNANRILVLNDRSDTLLLVAAFYLVPFAVLNLLDLWKRQQRVSESLRGTLQQQIFRKFLNFDELSRRTVSFSNLGLSMIFDADDIVNSGFMNVFELAKQLGKLSVSLWFVLQEDPDALPASLSVALCMVVFIATNYKKSVELRDNVSSRQACILDVAQEGAAKVALIRDYRVRPLMEQRMSTRIGALNEASLPLSVTSVTNDYFPGWLANLLVAGYMVYGGQAVLSGTAEIGTFLATINIFRGLGDTFKDTFTSCLDISKALAPLISLTAMLNKKIDLRDQKRINRWRRKTTKLERTQERLAKYRQLLGHRYGADLPIRLEGLTFAYPGEVAKLKNVNISVPQGTLVAVCGRRRDGKSTLIKLLGQVLQPAGGEIFVPSYLRILHVSAYSRILECDLWQNLTIGSITYWKDREKESQRVIRICRRLGFSQRMMEFLERTRLTFLNGGDICEEDNKCRDWISKLSISDTILVCLARAFIYNPEVLVMNRPTSQLADPQAKEVISLLREFVDNRGVEVPASEFAKRRPRTAFVSFARTSGVLSSDVVWLVEDSTVRTAAREEISQISLS